MHAQFSEVVRSGVGKFAVVDDAVVTENDLQTNFFVERTSLGKPRADEVARLLQELNSDTKGTSFVQVS
jgi:amyloid beta precursor protein binding protein 1